MPVGIRTGTASDQPPKHPTSTHHPVSAACRKIKSPSLIGQSVELTCSRVGCPEGTGAQELNHLCCLPAQDYHGRNPCCYYGGMGNKLKDWGKLALHQHLVGQWQCFEVREAKPLTKHELKSGECSNRSSYETDVTKKASGIYTSP